MKQFNVYFTIRGPGGELGAPNKSNPVPCESMRVLLEKLAESLPQPFGCEVVAICIEEVQP
jgi:hypothetical protein